MEAALLARFLAVPEIAALIGTAAAWEERPRRDALPALTLTLISSGLDYTHEGPDGLAFPWVQADCWAESGDEAAALADALRAEIHLPPRTVKDVAGVRFYPGFIESDRTVPPEDLDGGPTVHRRMLEFRFYWEAL